ncbi:MAG: DMT family transporter [Ignavibacteriae bacterium]|nr:DMT family transporter [Ignavibacteriota bacterium]
MQYKAESILLLVSLTWGLSFPMIKIGLEYSPPFTFVFIRFFITLIIFSIFFYKKILKFKFNEIKYGFYLGIFLFIGFITQTTGLKFTTASNSAFITGTNIVLLPFAQILIIKTKPKFENILGIIIVVIGLYFLTNIKSIDINFGDLITVFCAISFAFYIVLLDKFSGKTDTNALIFGQFVATTFLSLLSVLFFEKYKKKYFFGDVAFTLNYTLVGSLIYNSIFNTFLGLFLSTRYQKFTSPVRAGLIYNMEQIFAVIAAYFILREMFTGTQIIGAVIMIIGVVISEFYHMIFRRSKV